jgi:glycosyltransferase involved in cell wall biosynthesis
MSQVNEDPFVSVIVPAWNDCIRLRLLLDALMAQTYPETRYEVIVVDNGSTDGSYAAAMEYPVLVLSETAAQSSYAARNRGIEAAKGSILAFTDSDCIPIPDWLGNGVRALTEHNADLAGGSVRMFSSPNETGAELYDLLETQMWVEPSIRERGVVATWNLFVRAEVFELVGFFPGDVESSGDTIWTRRASQSGHRLVYAPDAVVAHPARRLLAKVRKAYRVGRGQNAQWSAEARRPRRVFNQAIGHILRADTPTQLRQGLADLGYRVRGLRLARVWFAGVTSRVVTATGNLVTLLRGPPDVHRNR